MRSMKPTGSNILVRLGPKLDTLRAARMGVSMREQPTDAPALVLPDKYVNAPRTGTVIAVGPGRVMGDGRRDELGVSVGDTVVFGPYNGVDITAQLGAEDGERYWLLSQWKKDFAGDAPDVYGRLEE